jgi:hypothetical protein
MKLLPVASQDQLADFFTKSLLPKHFSFFLSKMELKDLYQLPSCGGLSQSAKEEVQNTKEQDNLQPKQS